MFCDGIRKESDGKTSAGPCLSTFCAAYLAGSRMREARLLDARDVANTARISRRECYAFRVGWTMRDGWLKVVEAVGRPLRPRLDVCLAARDAHVESRRAAADMRARAIAQCTARIEAARAEVFAANTGVVTARMTELEREWRMLSRVDLDGGLMDLWARIAPATWIDRKGWRHSAPAARLEAVVALASDPQGVEAAEAAAATLRSALIPYDISLPARVLWHPSSEDFAGIDSLLASPRSSALRALSTHGDVRPALARAQETEQDVRAAANARFPERGALAHGIAHAAFVDFIWHASGLPAEENPTTSLKALWSAGYGLARIDTDNVTLTFPAL